MNNYLIISVYWCQTTNERKYKLIQKLSPVLNGVWCDMFNSFFVSAAKILEKNIIEIKVNEYHPRTMAITEHSEHWICWWLDLRNDVRTFEPLNLWTSDNLGHWTFISFSFWTVQPSTHSTYGFLNLSNQWTFWIKLNLMKVHI